MHLIIRLETWQRPLSCDAGETRKGMGMLYDNVLVPYDGSASADAALAEAARFAKEDPGLSLHVVSVVDIEHIVI